MTRAGRRKLNVKKHETCAGIEKNDNVMNKVRRYESLINRMETERNQIIGGRNKEKMPFFDQIKVADITVELDELNYKLSYCAKFMELSMKYVHIYTSLPFIVNFMNFISNKFQPNCM